jgi:putative heme-binding domain-containing protein
MPALAALLILGLNPSQRRLFAQAGADGEDYARYAIYGQTAPRAGQVQPTTTVLPLKLLRGDRIALIGNTLMERSQSFGHLEAFIQRHFPDLELVVRYLAWSGDQIEVQPRPANFADTEQHLTHEKADVILAAFGFNESFGGDERLESFRKSLTDYVSKMRSTAFNGRTGPRLVLVSPIANENVSEVPAADLNNARIRKYLDAMREVAARQQVGFANVFDATAFAMESPGNDLTINGVHLNEQGDRIFSQALFHEVFAAQAPALDERLRLTVQDKNRQYFRRFRPLNAFYYTGGRNEQYGYLDFLPAMKAFDLMVANRDRRIWDLAQGHPAPERVDDSNVPPLPKAVESRGANEWRTAEQELAAFKIDPRFAVNLFAGEEQFPEIANPIQMRWDARGRLWVSCSTTYPHVYPGNEPHDKLVILEDTDGDGRADQSTVFADDLQIPLSFELGDGGVYVSEQPHLTFLQDTDGDDRADVHRVVLSGFGAEDSHHALHDFTWTPDGDLLFRESIFLHSQVETPYGPVLQQNSGWFRFTPRNHRLISFGSYESTNPWGVTFDDWGQHVASHPVYAAAFHSLDPPYPQQHPRPEGLQAYSGVCGHEFVDFATFPDELRNCFIKVRYKPTNRVEIHKWEEGPFGFEEEYIGDLLFSSDLSFIPVDLQYGPRGDLYVCDWYNPVKGHSQYSLRDERRDRHSGRIWRITTRGKPLIEPPAIETASIVELLEHLKRPEYRVRYWAKRELRERDPMQVKAALDRWAIQLDPRDPRFRHHQMEAVWCYRGIDQLNLELLRELLVCDDHRARAAATQQLRHWHGHLSDTADLLRGAANDASGIVRMEAAIAASYIGTQEAFLAMLDVLKHPCAGHLAYAVTCSLGSRSMRQHWEDHPQFRIADWLKQRAREREIKEPPATAEQAAFDARKDLQRVEISCIPERMLFTVADFTVRPDQPVKLIFTNPDATDHNLVIVRPGALAEVGMAANAMAKDPRNAASDFVPRRQPELILHASAMIGPTRASLIDVLRFHAPKEPGIYPYVCTFPGHWVVMNGIMIVAESEAQAAGLREAAQPRAVREWTMADFADLDEKQIPRDADAVMRGMAAFVKARCNQCHAAAGHGVNYGPDLVESIQRLRGSALLQQIIEPSSRIHENFRNTTLLTTEGRVITGVIAHEDDKTYRVATNLLTPASFTAVSKQDVEQKTLSTVSPMPMGLVNVLTREEIMNLLAFIQAGKFQHEHH